MKIHARLTDRILACEYVYATGYRTREAAESRIDDWHCEGDISPAEKPRAVAYANADGVQRWAVVLTDTSMAAYT